eukprot:Platyproteum_vivax@DN2193_c0_g1_i1.p1
MNLQLTILLLGILFISNVAGHGYMLWPKARNVVYPPNYCAHCMNGAGGGRTAARQAAGNSTAYGIRDRQFPLEILLNNGFKSPGGLVLEPNGVAVRHGVCGDPSQNDVDGTNFYNTPLKNYPVQGVFLAGGEIEIEVILTAHHRGHFEFLLCDAEGLSDEEVLNQECFNKYPLTRAYKVKDHSPIDTRYPDRFYVPPSCYKDRVDQSGVPVGPMPPGHREVVTYNLPSKQSSRMVLQWHYWTANTCLPIGYRTEYFANISNKHCDEDWVNFNLPSCSDNYPEEFWNCADIELTYDATKVTAKADIGKGPTGTTPPVLTGTWDKDWSLGGADDESGDWKRNCGCKQVGWPTVFEAESDCAADWRRNDLGCSGRTDIDPTGPSTSTTPPPQNPDTTPVPRIGTWAFDYSSQGEWVPSAQKWMRNCDCKVVSWPTLYVSREACRNAFIASDGLCMKA